MSENAVKNTKSIPLDPTRDVHFDEVWDGWHAYSYTQVRDILTDDAHFSADYGPPSEEQHPAFAGMWAADGERHRDLRAMAADPFRPRVLVQLSHSIRQIIDELLDKVMDRKSFEVVSDLARPLAFRTIAMILEVDREDYRRFIIWQDELRAVQMIGQAPVQPDFIEYLRALLRDRRQHPRSGLIDELIDAHRCGYQVAGKPMAEWDLIGYLATLLTAGADTTAAGIANALVNFVQFDAFRHLSLHQSTIHSALEESLRWSPAFPAIRRNIKQDVELGGQVLRAGQYVTAWVSSANRDAHQFADPNSFQLTRFPNRHLSFGWSRHHCLGAPLARLQMQLATQAFIERVPLTLRLAKPVEYSFSVVHAPVAGHFLWN